MDMFKWLKIDITIMMVINITGITCALNLMAAERDPFVSIIDLQAQRATVKKIDLSQIVLKGIIWNKSQAIAIINDELVMVGDDWQGFKVERIDKDSVTLKESIGLDEQAKYYKLFIEEAIPSGKERLTIPMGLPATEGFGQQEGIPGFSPSDNVGLPPLSTEFPRGGNLNPQEGGIPYSQEQKAEEGIDEK